MNGMQPPGVGRLRLRFARSFAIMKQILLMFVKDFFLKVAQKKGRTKRTHQIAGFEKMM